MIFTRRGWNDTEPCIVGNTMNLILKTVLRWWTAVGRVDDCLHFTHVSSGNTCLQLSMIRYTPSNKKILERVCRLRLKETVHIYIRVRMCSPWIPFLVNNKAIREVDHPDYKIQTVPFISFAEHGSSLLWWWYAQLSFFLGSSTSPAATAYKASRKSCLRSSSWSVTRFNSSNDHNLRFLTFKKLYSMESMLKRRKGEPGAVDR